MGHQALSSYGSAGFNLYTAPPWRAAPPFPPRPSCAAAAPWRRVALTRGCQIGYVDHTGGHQLVSSPIRPTRVAATPRVSDWLYGPYWLSSTGAPHHTRRRLGRGRGGARLALGLIGDAREALRLRGGLSLHSHSRRAARLVTRTIPAVRRAARLVTRTILAVIGPILGVIIWCF